MSQEHPETLSDFIRRIMNAKNLTSYKVQKNSGNRIHQSYVIKLTNDGTQNVSAVKLKALALGLGVTEEEIFAIVRQEKPSKEVVLDQKIKFLSQKFSELSPVKKEKLAGLLEIVDREIDRASSS